MELIRRDRFHCTLIAPFRKLVKPCSNVSSFLMLLQKASDGRTVLLSRSVPERSSRGEGQLNLFALAAPILWPRVNGVIVFRHLIGL
jgi:hypothetical protein